MKDCERFEVMISAWLDGEIDRDEEIELVDHLVRCPSCRCFYADARALEGAIALVKPADPTSVAPREIWTAIEEKSRRSQTARRTIPAWALRAAAAVLLAGGLSGVVWFTGGGPAIEPARPGDALIALGEDAGRMTEERFIELTKEVLRAEPRYRTAMYRVMQQVVRETTPVEGMREAELAGAFSEERPILEIAAREPV